MFVFSLVHARISSPAGRRDIVILSDRQIRSCFSILRQRGTENCVTVIHYVFNSDPTYTRAMTHSVIKTKPLQTWHDICHPGHHHRSGLLTSPCHSACSDQKWRNSLIGCRAQEQKLFHNAVYCIRQLGFFFSCCKLAGVCFSSRRNLKSDSHVFMALVCNFSIPSLFESHKKLHTT